MLDWLKKESLEGKLIVIPGVEVSTSDGHLLVLMPTEEFEIGIEPLEVIQRAKERGSVVVAPHPFHNFRHGIGKRKDVLKKVDAIESINSKYVLRHSNLMAERFAKTFKIPMVGGSDSHSPSTIGMAYTVVEAEPTTERVVEAVREGRCHASGGRSPLTTIGTMAVKNTLRKAKMLKNSGQK